MCLRDAKVGGVCVEEGGINRGRGGYLLALCQLLNADVLHVALCIEVAELVLSGQLQNRARASDHVARRDDQKSGHSCSTATHHPTATEIRTLSPTLMAETVTLGRVAIKRTACARKHPSAIRVALRMCPEPGLRIWAESCELRILESKCQSYAPNACSVAPACGAAGRRCERCCLAAWRARAGCACLRGWRNAPLELPSRCWNAQMRKLAGAQLLIATPFDCAIQIPNSPGCFRWSFQSPWKVHLYGM